MFDQNAGLGEAMARSHSEGRIERLEREVQQLRQIVSQQQQTINALMANSNGAGLNNYYLSYTRG